MKDLFTPKNLRVFTKKDLKTLRVRIRREQPTEEEFKNNYHEYRGYLKKRAREIRLLDLETIYKILMGGAYAFKKDLPEFISGGEKSINYEDLDKFLSVNVEQIYRRGNLTFKKLPWGSKFLESFTREYYSNVPVEIGSNATEDDLISIFEVCNISLHLATAQTIMNTRRYFSTYTHSSNKYRFQFVSNFNPLISAYLFQKYGFESMGEGKVLNLHSSSEGWLSRLLASYYVARRNPGIMVNYESIDPNIKVVEAFSHLCDFLKGDKKYHLENWNPRIVLGGSEDPECYHLKEVDCSFTSPPYLDLEKYPDTYIFKIVGAESLYYSEDHMVTVGKQTYFSKKKAKEIRVGDFINGFGEVESISKTPQCATFYKKPRPWNLKFAKPTMRNIYAQGKEGSYFIWNVVNNRKHIHMVRDSLNLAKGEGFTKVETLKYPLSRKPASSGKQDSRGRNIRLADIKAPYEPILVFKI